MRDTTKLSIKKETVDEDSKETSDTKHSIHDHAIAKYDYFAQKVNKFSSANDLLL